MGTMDQEQKRKIRNRITVISLAALVVVAVFFFLAAGKQLLSQGWLMGILISFLVFYWALTDVVEPMLLRELKDMSAERRKCYLKFAGADALGFAALAYFVFNIGNSNNYGIVGALIYVFCLNVKRKAKEEFYDGTGDVSPAQETDTEEIREEQSCSDEDSSGK